MSEGDSKSKQKKTPSMMMRCPHCHTSLEWQSNNPYRPFCSQRRRDADFCNWANQENVISGNSTYDDLLSEDLISDETKDKNF